MSVVAKSEKPFTSSIIPNNYITSNIITLELIESITSSGFNLRLEGVMQKRPLLSWHYKMHVKQAL
jgi:hypothetical protein